MKIQEQRVTADGINNRVILILDDMAADQAMRYANIISELAYNGRHLQIDVSGLINDELLLAFGDCVFHRVHGLVCDRLLLG